MLLYSPPPMFSLVGWFLLFGLLVLSFEGCLGIAYSPYFSFLFLETKWPSFLMVFQYNRFRHGPGGWAAMKTDAEVWFTQRLTVVHEINISTYNLNNSTAGGLITDLCSCFMFWRISETWLFHSDKSLFGRIPGQEFKWERKLAPLTTRNKSVVEHLRDRG